MAASRRGSFFPALLLCRVTLGVAGVGCDLAPAMARQQPIHHRVRYRMAQALRQRGPQRPDGRHAAICRLLGPGQEEFKFLLATHRSVAPASPVRVQFGRMRQMPAHLGLVSADGGATHAKRGGGLFQRRIQQRRQEHGLCAAQLLKRHCTGGQPLGVLHKPGVDRAWSGHGNLRRSTKARSFS